MSDPNYWIAVLSQDHVDGARAGAYVELNQGRVGFLERMRSGDRVVFYSPRTRTPRGEPVQAFTAAAQITDATLRRVALADGSCVFRLTARYASAQPAPIKPLLDQLSFIRNRQHWGAAFRFGGLRVPAHDFARIAAAMQCPELAPQPALV